MKVCDKCHIRFRGSFLVGKALLRHSLGTVPLSTPQRRAVYFMYFGEESQQG